MCCFFFKKSCKNDLVFFSQRQTFKKCHILLHVHYTQVENHQFRVFLLHYFLLLFFRQRSFFHKLVASFCFHGFLFVIGWKLLLLLSFLNMFKLVCCLDWFYEKCTTKYGEHWRRLKDDKTNTKGIEIFSSPNFFLIPGDEKNSRWILIPGLLVSQDQKKWCFDPWDIKFLVLRLCGFFIWFFWEGT